MKQAIKDDGDVRVELDYKLFKGASVQFNDLKSAPEAADKIASLPSVKRVWPVRVYGLPVIEGQQAGKSSPVNLGGLSARDDKDTYSTHVQTQIDKMHNMGIKGTKDTKVAILDTGIDYKHPALGGCFGPGCLVGFGTDLVGDDYTGFNTPQPDADPMDCGGHGSHVAGIIAAQPNEYGVLGAAPNVTMGIYRVFGCSGFVSNDVLLSAMNKAFEDGATIISASIVVANGWSEDPLAVVASRISEAGVPVLYSQGNDGDHGLFYNSNSADGKSVIAVAAFDNSLYPSFEFESKYAIDGGDKQPFRFVFGLENAWDLTLPLWATSLDSTIANDACNPLPDNTPDLSNNIVLVRRGGCLFVDKFTNLAKKGARYVLFYQNAEAPIFAPTFAPEPAQLKAAGMIPAAAGVALVSALKSGKKVTMYMEGPATAKSYTYSTPNNITGGALSSFTSWGPNWEMDMKPQYGAIGGNVLSTIPQNQGSYGVKSGTSMSCPQAAGMLALLRQVRGPMDIESINNLFAATSKPQLFNDNTKFYDKLASVAQQGAGLMQIYDAAFTKTLLQPSGLVFNDTKHYTPSLNFTISNTGDSSVSYKIGNIPAMTFYTLGADGVSPMMFPNDAVNSYASVKFSQDSLTLEAGQRAVLSISATPPVGIDLKRLALWSGFVTVNGTDGSALSIPYQGLSGSLQEHAVILSGQSWISNSTDAKFNPVAENTTFILPPPGTADANAVLPQITFNLNLGSPYLRVDLTPMTTCPPKNLTTQYKDIKTIGQPFGTPYSYLPRGISSVIWDGKLKDNGAYAPAGKYKAVIRALRIFGNPDNDADWDVVSTPRFVIKYKK